MRLAPQLMIGLCLLSCLAFGSTAAADYTLVLVRGDGDLFVAPDLYIAF